MCHCADKNICYRRKCCFRNAEFKLKSMLCWHKRMFSTHHRVHYFCLLEWWTDCKRASCWLCTCIWTICEFVLQQQQRLNASYKDRVKILLIGSSATRMFAHVLCSIHMLLYVVRLFICLWLTGVHIYCSICMS